MSFITELPSDGVFVFGSNASGFHGAGAAGYACRGTSTNDWRDDPWFQKALKAPAGHPDRIGKWAVLGVARGPQQGREGKSYAIETVRRPGLKRSVPLSEIREQLVRLFAFAAKRPHLRFFMTPLGAHYAGYSAAEMRSTLDTAGAVAGGVPSNIIVPPDLYR